MGKLSSLLLVYAVLLALTAYDGGTTNETPAADTPAFKAPASEIPAAEAPAESGESAVALGLSAPVTQFYYNSDVAELEGAWTLAQVYTNGETSDAVVDIAAFTITFSLDPSELVDQTTYTHNQVYNLTDDLIFSVVAINNAPPTDNLDGYRGSTGWPDLPQGQMIVEDELHQQPSPAIMHFQDVDAYDLFLNQLAAGIPADVDATERNLILDLSNQDQFLLGTSEEYLERPGREDDWAYCLIFDKAT